MTGESHLTEDQQRISRLEREVLELQSLVAALTKRLTKLESIAVTTNSRQI